MVAHWKALACPLNVYNGIFQYRIIAVGDWISSLEVMVKMKAKTFLVVVLNP